MHKILQVNIEFHIQNLWFFSVPNDATTANVTQCYRPLLLLLLSSVSALSHITKCISHHESAFNIDVRFSPESGVWGPNAITFLLLHCYSFPFDLWCWGSAAAQEKERYLSTLLLTSLDLIDEYFSSRSGFYTLVKNSGILYKTYRS